MSISIRQQKRRKAPKESSMKIYTKLRSAAVREAKRVEGVEGSIAGEIALKIMDLHNAFLYEKQKLEISCNSKIDQANEFARKQDEKREAVKDRLLNCEGMSKEELIERLLRLV